MDIIARFQLVADLKAIRELLATPQTWCRTDFAQTAHGRVVDPCERDAARWDVTGAIYNVTGTTDEFFQRRRAMRSVLNDLVPRGRSLLGLEDDPAFTHADLLQLLDAAIANAERMAEPPPLQLVAE